MLTRLFIDNFRCFVNFEHRPGKRELILGGNGSGKSSFIDALLFLRLFAGRGDKLPDLYTPNHLTRWLDKTNVTFEIDAELPGGCYTYRLAIQWSLSPVATWVDSETVHFIGKKLFEFADGKVHLYTDDYQEKVVYEFDASRSALATIVPGHDNRKLSRFKEWLGGLLSFRLNPFLMGARAEGEELSPTGDLRNISQWYRHLVQDSPPRNVELTESLRNSLSGFSHLRFESIGQNVSLLKAVFGRNEFYFNELSDGQRCLICLYIILHFLIARGYTVLLDEPDNFISLREIQPWLTAVADAVEDGDGQVLIVSHHPELINQWAPENGVMFVRDDAGPVRVEKFRAATESCLSPAELVARGWESE